MNVSMTVNNKTVAAEVEPRTLLVQFLREKLRLTGTHVGCDTSQCGACVVHIDGKAVKACTTLALSCEGTQVTTIEGLANGTALHPMQEAFREHHGLQCGFCTPGMIMTAVDIVNRRGPDRDERRSAKSSRATSAAARATITSSRRSRPAAGDARTGARVAADNGADDLTHEYAPAAQGRTTRSMRSGSARRNPHERTSGIGASVRRKEDVASSPARAVHRRHQSPWPGAMPFLRSPHAHATINGIDLERAVRMPGVVAIFTGRGFGGRQDRRLDLRLDDPLEGRLAHEGGAASGAGAGQGALRGRPRRGRDRRHRRAGARTPARRSWSTTTCCRPWR